MTNIIPLSTADFESKVLSSDKPVLVDCKTEWCRPCAALHPVLEKLAAENPNISFFSIDIDDNPEIAQKYGIRSIPTLLLFKNGQVQGTLVGMQSKEKVQKLLDSLALGRVVV